jgi:hypothetical protein
MELAVLEGKGDASAPNKNLLQCPAVQILDGTDVEPAFGIQSHLAQV